MFVKNMQILKATPDNVLAASHILKNGGLVIYPTDTVYGLGCDPLNPEAIKRILKAKGKKRKKPLPILASSKEQVERIALLSEKALKIAEKFWPGYLTIVLPKKRALPNIVTCNLDSVGVRVPRHETAMQLISLSGGLLVGTSANRSGMKPPRTAQEAASQIGKEVDLIIDGGPAALGVSSTVVDLTAETPSVRRKGPVGLKEIMDAVSSI
jgi:L-threonylcarbamoyladenylate synthase